MERARWSVGGDGEMHNQNISVFCEIDEFRVGAVLIRTEHNRDAPRLHAVGKRRQVGMWNAECGHADSVAVEHVRWFGLGHVNDTDIEAWALSARLLDAESRAKHLVCSGLGIEHATEECREIGRDIVTGWADDRQRLAANAIASPHQGSEVGGVIGMQMADADHCEIGKLRPALPEADVAAATDVEQKLGLCTYPQQIGCRGPFGIDGRAAGAENLHSDRTTNAGL